MECEDKLRIRQESGAIVRKPPIQEKEGTYEITYEAVDYSGFKVAKKFYVKVVK